MQLIIDDWKRDNHGVRIVENVKWCGWKKCGKARLVHTWRGDGMVMQFYRQVEWHKDFPASRVVHYITGNHYHSQGITKVSVDYRMEAHPFREGIDHLAMDRRWRNNYTKGIRKRRVADHLDLD